MIAATRNTIAKHDSKIQQRNAIAKHDSKTRQQNTIVKHDSETRQRNTIAKHNSEARYQNRIAKHNSKTQQRNMISKQDSKTQKRNTIAKLTVKHFVYCSFVYLNSFPCQYEVELKLKSTESHPYIFLTLHLYNRRFNKLVLKTTLSSLSGLGLGEQIGTTEALKV